MFEAEHGEADVGVALGEEFGLDAVDFVAEEEEDGPAGLPIEEVYGGDGGFDGGDFVALLAEVLDGGEGLAAIDPGDGVFGAEGGFGDGVLGRARGDAAQVEAFEAGAVGGTEEGAGVVHAADVIQEHRDR